MALCKALPAAGSLLGMTGTGGLQLSRAALVELQALGSLSAFQFTGLSGAFLRSQQQRPLHGADATAQWAGLHALTQAGDQPSESQTARAFYPYSHPALLPHHQTLLRSGLLLQVRHLHTSPSSAFWGPSAAAYAPARTSSDNKDAPASPKPPVQVPKAEDCDSVISDYDDLRTRLDAIAKPSSIRSWGQRGADAALAVWRGTLAVLRFLVSIPSRYQRFMAMPKEEWQAKKASAWKSVKHEAHHYWVGMKLLAYEVRIASAYALKAARGQPLTRRERRQLTRTAADLFRLVPMIIILVVPFLEFTLPVLLRLFPNMLPSTFEDKLKKEEEMKRRLAVRLELAKFLQDTVSEMAKDLRVRATGDKAVTATELYEFIKRVRAGEPVENHEFLKFAQLFNDELTLDALERVQLESMCQFVGISPFGTSQYLRTRLRAHLQQIKRDDYEIEREGLEHLTEDELRQACRARGMRGPFGEGAVAFMRRQLQDWLDLSLHRGLPSSLLLLSRAFTITATVKDVAAKKDIAYSKLKETLGVIPEGVVESVQVEALGDNESAEAMAKRLEFLKREEKAIKEEAAVAKAQAAEAKADAAAAAAPAAGADGAQKAAVAGGPAAPAGVTPQMQAAAAGVASAVVGSALGLGASRSDALSDEERAAKAVAEREARVTAIMGALLSLASSGGVASERALFMDLVKTEIGRLNKSLAKKAVTSSMNFSSAGLQVAASPAEHSAEPQAAATGAAAAEHGAAGAPAAKLAPPADEVPVSASRLSASVTKMLHSIEKELDKVETSIGSRMHVLDTDRDGVISRDELLAAITFLKDRLDPTDMELLFQRLGAAATSAGAGAAAPADGAAGGGEGGVSKIRVEELLAAVQQAKTEQEQDVVKVHTQ